MTDKVYSPYKLAIELGFTEEQARRFEWNGTDATNMRRIAEHLGLPSTKPDLAKPKPKTEQSRQDDDESGATGKKHKHYYRKDGTCRCGVARKVKS